MTIRSGHACVAHDFGARGDRVQRPAARANLVVLAMLATLAVLGAACANGSTATGGSTGGGGGSGVASTNGRHDQAVQFAECMRRHGVAAFPDPDASGELTIDGIANGSGVDTSTAAFERAISACQSLAPPGFTGRKRSAREQEVALAFARCIREHGVADFPDPTPDGPLVDTNRIPSLAASDDLRTLNAAMRTCHEVVAELLEGP